MNIKKQIHYKISALLFLGMLFLSSVACTVTPQPITYTDYYFNTVVNLTFYNETDASLAEECFKICEEYENMLSRTVEESDIWNINQGKGEAVVVSEETYNLIKEALFYCELTEGRIDITVAPLMDLWNFTEVSDNKIPPTHEEIQAKLAHVDYTLVELGPDNSVTLKDPEAAIDLGFIAKGYIADRLKEYPITQGVTSALINLGGNVITIGNKPDGSPYTIGIQKPFAPIGTTLDTVQVTDSSIVTSGTYERYFTYKDRTYHHILDATTGEPVENTLTGVTILCPSSTKADALSTTCFVMGKDSALSYIQSLEDAECILVDDTGAIYDSYQ